MPRRSELEERFLEQIKEQELPLPDREFKFSKSRRWKADFAYPLMQLLIEIEGGLHMKKSRHTSPKGYAADCEKYTFAAALGWRVFRFTGDEVQDGRAISFLLCYLLGFLVDEKPKRRKKKKDE